MRREKTFKRSLLLLAIMSIMLFAMTITASAASAVTGLKQTGDGTSSVKVSWTANPNEYYRVMYSTSRDGSYVRANNNTSKYDSANGNDYYISGLNSGATYYVKIYTLTRDAKYNYYVVAQSAPLQVVTRPGDVVYKTVKQTSGTTKKIGITWGKVSGATAYKVVKYYNSKPAKNIYTSTNKATIPVGAGRHYGAYIYPYRKSETGYVAMSSYGTSAGTLYAAPVNPQYLADANANNLTWKPAQKGNVITIGWKPNPNYDYPTGYQIQLYSVDGKTRLYTTNPLTGRSVTINNAKVRKAINNKGFKVRIRAYKEAKGGAKCWSDWSAFKTIIPQACVKKSNVTSVSSTAAKVTWKKVANTKYYLVYYSKNPYSSNAKWIKKKVSAKRNSYTIRGLKAYSTFGVYVVPVVKVGGKTYRGQACEYIRCSYYYR